MRLPVYLQLALAVVVGSLSSDDLSPPPAQLELNSSNPIQTTTSTGATSTGPAAMFEDRTEVSVCRRTSPVDPADLDTDTVLIAVRNHVDQMLASVPAEDSDAVLSALRFEYGEVERSIDVDYIWYYDTESSSWIRFCQSNSTFSIRASTLENPIEVVVDVSYTL